MSDVQAISVTQLARRIRNLLEIQVGEIWVEGEISNLRKQASGHWYFSLKDDSAQISCAMFGAKRRAGAEVIEEVWKERLAARAAANGHAQGAVAMAAAWSFSLMTWIAYARRWRWNCSSQSRISSTFPVVCLS